MRILIDSELQECEGLSEDNIYSSGAIADDDTPDRPFAVVRMGVETRGMGQIKRRSITIWVHDDPGDYTRIDSIIQAIYGRLDGAQHVTKEGVAGELMSVQWQSTSDDLNDPGFRTITKNIVFEAVGTGA
jgi:hypothetical protein